MNLSTRMQSLATLTDDERRQFMELINESSRIKTHLQLFRWLQGPLQRYLPHDALIAAWGDFQRGSIHYDVISHLPGVRTRNVGNDGIAPFLSRLFAYWDSNGCASSVLGLHDRMALNEEWEHEPIAKNCRDVKSIVVHAIKDVRGQSDCLYVLLSKTKTNSRRVCAMFETLLPHIDVSLRKVPLLPEQIPSAAQVGEPGSSNPDWCLTPREAEVMRLVRLGKTNIEIGMILDVSVCTVKNHLQHVFRKLNVNNRAQAVAKF